MIDYSGAMRNTSIRVVRTTVFSCLLAAAAAVLPAEPLFSPQWGFRLDPPEGYGLVGGDGKNRFSFANDEGASFDLVAYPAGRFASVEDLAADVVKRLLAEAETSAFAYRGKKAVLLKLSFAAPSGRVEGWGLCVELADQAGRRPLLLALAYGKKDEGNGLELLHLSALDSIVPTEADRRASGPLTAFSFPSTGKKTVRVALTDAEAVLDASDAEASAAVVDREFSVLTRYSESPLWKEAWARFYRAVYRDAYDRLAGVAFSLERAYEDEAQTTAVPAAGGAPADEGRVFAERVLAWTQGFAYERDLMGNDFVDPVSAALEGRGDCDTRSLLLAVVLTRSNIPSCMMVSREYGHAMGLVEIEGEGARFEHDGRSWTVAETTAKVPLGRIAKNVSDPSKWLGIAFE